jgi:prepilin-type N-terminal cleavage/methylation domain-containing protein
MRTRGFTLIELLIVVLIIAILAAIAVPNFLEFQTRAKVSRVKSDQRSLATAVEAYYVDNNEYPAMGINNDSANGKFTGTRARDRMVTFRIRTPFGGSETFLHTLTTPVSYVTSLFSDPFASTKGALFGYRQFAYTWILISYGPDRDEQDGSDHLNEVATVVLNPPQNNRDSNFETTFEITISQPSSLYLATSNSRGGPGTALIYDPTNGTTSEGDVVRIKQ